MVQVTHCPPLCSWGSGPEKRGRGSQGRRLSFLVTPAVWWLPCLEEVWSIWAAGGSGLTPKNAHGVSCGAGITTVSTTPCPPTPGFVLLILEVDRRIVLEVGWYNYTTRGYSQSRIQGGLICRQP